MSNTPNFLHVLYLLENETCLSLSVCYFFYVKYSLNLDLKILSNSLLLRVNTRKISFKHTVKTNFTNKNNFIKLNTLANKKTKELLNTKQQYNR